MAYPLKKYTYLDYVSLSPSVYTNIDPDKIYYMPEITNKNVYWQISFYDVAEPKQPVATLSNFKIYKGYRVIYTTEVSGTISSQQSHFVIDNGYDNQDRPWINATNNFGSLPIGTVVTWTVFTQSYSATTDGPYTSGKELIGTYLKFSQGKPPLPSVQSIVYTQGQETTVYKYRIYIINNNGEIVLNQEYDPNLYELTGLLIKNEISVN